MKIVREGRTPYIYESRFRRKDGQTRAFIGAIERVEIGGRPYYVGMFYDITDRKRAERSLRESEAKFVKLFRANPLPCTIARISDERLTDVNDAFCAATGFRREDVIGRTSLEINAIVNPEERAAVFQATREGRTPYVREVSFRMPSGEIRHCILATERIEVGGEAYALTMIYDITDRKRLDEERLRLSKLESVSVLAGGIAHDFNNLLTAILGNVGLAKQYAAASPRAVAKLEAVERAGGRAKSLSKRLLTFARGGEPVREPTALPSLVQEAMQFVLHDSPVACRFAFSDGLWLAMADAGQLEQVFQNLALNARDAMPDGGALEVRARNVALDDALAMPLAPGRYVKISVRDAGAGIAPENLPKIFDPYFTTKTTGSGLGLAVVHSIVTKHAGYVAVSSRVGVGTTFDVYLPAVAEPEADHRADAPTDGGAECERRRILVMDDEEMVREMTRALLEELGYRVQECRDGAEAVERYAAARSAGSPFDAVVMDLVVMGGVGGREALEKLLAIDENVQAIACSGYSSDQVMANFRKYGFCGKLEKPFSLEDLQNVLEGVFLHRE
jgi:PAS domain S-box-containing protein